MKYWRCDPWVKNKLHIAFGTHRSSRLECHSATSALLPIGDYTSAWTYRGVASALIARATSHKRTSGLERLGEQQ